MKQLELLSPAKNAEQGIAAVNHGADAVYIGAPLFGARSAAGNSIEDIGRLVSHAHLYGAKVYATVNTLLFDNEIDAAHDLIWQLYDIGTDALIVQDMGLLEIDLPPIALHASTQTHNIDPERIKFLENVGFQRVILARETSLEQMRALRQLTSVELESFVQGALCVCYSGQCYMSQYLSGRSGNRGCCAQPCRSSYDLYGQTSTGKELRLLRRGEHLLSLKDFNASQHIASMIDAGITSFKIEGRLKDLSYVKNVTAYYRQLLDRLLEGRPDCRAASDGVTRFFFTPDLERTFNRGFTDYCLNMTASRDGGTQSGRQKMASRATQKSLGKKIATVVRTDRTTVTVRTTEALSAGDGLCFFNTDGVLEGFGVNRQERVATNVVRIQPHRMPPDIAVGATLWRNNDFAFEKLLQGSTSERKIPLALSLSESVDGFVLEARDANGTTASVAITQEKTPARDGQRATEQMERQLSKLGDTPFALQTIEIHLSTAYFLPASVLNDLRRQVIDKLTEKRIAERRPRDVHFAANAVPYVTASVDYRANIVNDKAAQFYQRHGVAQWEYGLDRTHDYAGKALMTTKYCLRYELGMCLRDPANKERGPLYLRNNKNLFLLNFDCTRCEMQILPAEPAE